MANKLGLMFLTLAVVWLVPAAAAQNANDTWVTAWGTSQQALGETKITNATVRMIARVTIPGESVKVRLVSVHAFAVLPSQPEWSSH